MTTLAITPNWKNKSAKFRGTVAAGEHVSVTIQNENGEGGEFIEDVSTLRLRVVNPCNGRTLAIFPEPAPEGETPETWDADLSPLRCTLNLNTVQMLKAVPPAANVPLLWVLDDYDNKTLYFKEQFPVEHWPRLRGEEEPTDLDNYKDIIADFSTRLTTAEENVANSERAALAAETAAIAARDAASAAATAATDAQAGAIASKNAAQTAANDAASAKTAAETAQGKAQEAQEAAETAQGKAQEYAEAAAESAAAFVVDDTLSVEGAAADAKAVGDANQDLITRIETVQDNLDSEVTARETLAAAVGDNRQNLAAEIARAQSAEQGLDNRKADKTAVAAAIQAETSRAQTAEQGLRNDVSSAQTAIADRYTKSEVDAKIAGVQTFGKVVVQTLPDLADADDKTIYLVPRADSEAPDLCDEYVVVEEAGVRRWERIGAKAVDMTLDNSVTRTSANGVKSSGIWSAIWGALSALPTGFSSLYDWCVAQLAGKASTADATLTEHRYSEWNILHTPLTAEQKAAFYDENPTTAENDYAVTIRDTYLYVGGYWAASIVISGDGLSATYDAGSGEAGMIWGPAGTAVATRTALQGYQLGSQADKPLASEAEAEALRRSKADRVSPAIAGNLAALDTQGNPTDSGVAKGDVESLFFAQYYPDGNVKSAAEFTPNIKYGSFDDEYRTVSVLPFCNTGTAADDNSSLVGRVVIPPFVDSQGNPYISDDGTRFKVVGVSGSSPEGGNDNLTTVIAPNTVMDIGDRAFSYCTSLVSISLPSATTIGVVAFEECTSLVSVSLPAATTIGERAFFYCTSLVSISLPSATTIGVAAFEECSALTSVSLPAATNIGGSVFIDCFALTSVSLPAATNIGGGAFRYCTSLVSVDFGDIPRSSVPSIGSNAFESVPTPCKIVVPYVQYDAWKAATGWRDLPQDFVRHAEKADKPATFTAGNLAKFDANGNPTDSTIPAANVATKGNIPYDRITITTGQLQDHAEQKVTLSAATTTLVLPVLTNLSGKVADFGIDVVNGYEVSGTPTAASFSLAGTIGTDYNLIVPDGEDWSEMSALAAGEMAIYYFTLSAFQIGGLPTWGVTKQVVTLVPVPTAP